MYYLKTKLNMTLSDTQLTSAKLLHGKLTPSLREEITNTLQEGAKGM